MIEEWKDITGYEGHYQVSNLSRIKSLKRVVVRSDNVELTLKERILNPSKDEDGYLKINLYNGGIAKKIRIHRLVAIAFVDRSDESFEVNHKDENKLNNSIDNLEWISHQDNMRYGTGIERRANSHSKPVIQMDLDGNVIKIWKSSADIGRTLGFYQGYVSNVCLGRRKTAYGFRWEFAK